MIDLHQWTSPLALPCATVRACKRCGLIETHRRDGRTEYANPTSAATRFVGPFEWIDLENGTIETFFETRMVTGEEKPLACTKPQRLKVEGAA